MKIKSPVFRECYAAAVANMMSFVLGTVTVWVSACRHYFYSDNSPLGPVSTEFISWSSSIPFLSALLGLGIWGNLSERLGRKPAGLILGLPLTAMYAMLSFSHNQTVVLTARFIGGFSVVGCIMCVTLYVKEISSSNMRAKLTNILTGSIVTGSLSIITLSAFVSYELVHIILLIWSLIYLILFSLLPETPVFHIKNNDYKKAKESLEWLRLSNKEIELSKEIEALKETFIKKSSIKFLDIFKNKYYFKTMVIGVFLQTALSNLNGISIFITFSSEIFEKLVHEADVSWYNIIFTVLKLVGTIITFWIMDSLGRKTYIVSSSLLMSAILFTLASYQYFELQMKFLALGLVFAYIVIYCCFCFPIMYIYLHEIISSESSNHIFTLMILSKNMGWFATTRMYNLVEEQISLEGIFLIFGIGCMVLAGVIMRFPESKNKSLQILKEELTG